MTYRIVPIEESHDRARFDCGVEPLDTWLKRYARQNEAKGLSRTFVLVAETDPLRILGYYTLSMAQLQFDTLPESLRRGLPRYPIPVARLARLAVDRAVRGQGLGGVLLVDAVQAVVRVAEKIGTFALLVDAKDESAARFYQHHGFIALPDSPRMLVMPLARLR